MVKRTHHCFHSVCYFVVFKGYSTQMYTALPLYSQIKLVHKPQCPRVAQTFFSLMTQNCMDMHTLRALQIPNHFVSELQQYKKK